MEKGMGFMDNYTDYWYKNRFQYGNILSTTPIVDITANDEDNSDIEKALAATQAQQAQQQQQLQQAGSEGTKEAPPWADLLEKLNLSPQGSESADMAAIAQAISSKSSQATTEAEKADVQTLMSEFAQYSSGYSVSTSDMDGKIGAQANTDTAEFKGREQLADLNKFFLVKKFAG